MKVKGTQKFRKISGNILADVDWRRARRVVLKRSLEPRNLMKIKGYNYEGPFNLSEFLDSYKTTGFQASNLGRAIEIIRKARKERATIYLGYTSSMVSCGVREAICYLVKNKFVDVIVTAAGGIEEDIVKTLKPYLLGEFEADGKTLREAGINRTGNLFVPNDRFIEFEKLMNKFFKYILQRQRKEKKIFSTSELVFEFGKWTKNKESICYWATKNNIPIYCPDITDGSFGDMLYFFKQNNPEIRIDITKDLMKLKNFTINQEKTCIIILGGGAVKHTICNANLFRDGADYAVYINTAQEFDGSDSGARPDEAVSWGKIKGDAEMVKVFADASIVFPLIVLGAFSKV